MSLIVYLFVKLTINKLHSNELCVRPNPASPSHSQSSALKELSNPEGQSISLQNKPFVFFDEFGTEDIKNIWRNVSDVTASHKLTLVQSSAFASTSPTLIRSWLLRKSDSMDPRATSASILASLLSTNNNFKLIANAAMSTGNFREGFQPVKNLITFPFLQIGPSQRKAPTKATGHIETTLVDRIWSNTTNKYL